MNELIPLNHKGLPPSLEDIPSSFEELGVAQLTQNNNKNIFLVLIPLAFFFLFKDRIPSLAYKPKLSAQSYDKKLTSLKPIPSPANPLDINALDRIARVLDGVKKVSSIQDLSKTLAKARSSSGKFNKEIIGEMIGLMGDGISEENKAQIHNITNMFSMMDKLKDVKKVFDVQRQIKTEGNNEGSFQIDTMFEAIKPMLSEELAKNIDQFKKMAQMMKLMSMFDTSKDSGDGQSEDSSQ